MYWPSAVPQANTADLGPITRPIWKTSGNNTILLINFDYKPLYDQIYQCNIKTFIGPIREKPVQYGYVPYWPDLIPVWYNLLRRWYGSTTSNTMMTNGFRSSCYWTDRNQANTEHIRIGLVFPVLAQWKFLYCIDRFDHIKAYNQS
jgi:hypothetical protein